jgi:hypothetical protein
MLKRKQLKGWGRVREGGGGWGRAQEPLPPLPSPCALTPLYDVHDFWSSARAVCHALR